MKTFGMAALAVILSGWAGAASAQSWFYDDDPYPRRWGYERGFDDDGWDRRPYRRYERERRYERPVAPPQPRADRRDNLRRRPPGQPDTRAGNCYTPPPRPHSAPRVICRY
jgi:hypothetical protein